MKEAVKLLSELYYESLNDLKEQQIINFQNEVDQIFAHFLKISLSEFRKLLVLDSLNKIVDEKKFDKQEVFLKIQTAVEQRLNRIPLQHIIGEANFYGLTLNVGDGVFIPRPETEVMVERALDFDDVPSIKVLDLCAGSGAIGLAFAYAFHKKHPLNECEVTFVECSENACEFLNTNVNTIRQLIDNDSISFKIVNCDAIKYLKECNQEFDIILTNPPYVPLSYNSEDKLSEEVLHDPPIALFSGEDGLELPLQIIQNIKHALSDRGVIFMEHFDSHSETISNELVSQQFSNVESFPDLNGILRFSCGVFLK